MLLLMRVLMCVGAAGVAPVIRLFAQDVHGEPTPVTAGPGQVMFAHVSRSRLRGAADAAGGCALLHRLAG